MQLPNAGRNARTTRRAVSGNPSTREEAFPEEMNHFGLRCKTFRFGYHTGWHFESCMECGRDVRAARSSGCDRPHLGTLNPRVRSKLRRWPSISASFKDRAKAIRRRLTSSGTNEVECSLVGRLSPTIGRAEALDSVYNVHNPQRMKGLTADG